MFEDDKTVDKLIRQRFFKIKDKSVELKPYELNEKYIKSYAGGLKVEAERSIQELQDHRRLKNKIGQIQVPKGIIIKDKRPESTSSTTTANGTPLFIPSQTYMWKIEIRNESAQPRKLEFVKAVPSKREFSIRSQGDSPTVISCETKPHIVSVRFKPLTYGNYRQHVLFQFSNFTMRHLICVVVSNEAELQLLKPGLFVYSFKINCY